MLSSNPLTPIVSLLIERLSDAAWHLETELQDLHPTARALLQDLEAQGLGLEYAPEQASWRLPGAADRLHEQQLWQLLPVSQRQQLSCLEVHQVLDSSNTYLLQKSPSPGPQACCVEFQLAGRGRQGRHWLAAYGGSLCLSIRWQWSQAPSGSLNLAFALACVEALQAQGVQGIGLKWPNDIVHMDAQGHLHKLGGLLLETCWQGDSQSLVLGLGLNVRVPQPALAPLRHGIEQAWMDLYQISGIDLERNQLAATLISALLAAEQEYREQGFQAFQARWSAQDCLQGHWVSLLRPGRETLSGIACGIDQQGGLRLRQGNLVESFYEGELCSVRM